MFRKYHGDLSAVLAVVLEILPCCDSNMETCKQYCSCTRDAPMREKGAWGPASSIDTVLEICYVIERHDDLFSSIDSVLDSVIL